MNHFDVIQSFLELCETSASSAEPIAAGFRKAVNGLGFPYFACFSQSIHSIPRGTPSSCITIPPRGSVNTASRDTIESIPCFGMRGAAPRPSSGIRHSTPRR